MPAGVAGAATRIRSIASPWPSSRWCTAATAADSERTPGACRPDAYPTNAEHHGSFSVSQPSTRSPRRDTTDSA